MDAKKQGMTTQERIFDKIFHVAELAKFTPSERMAYEESIKYYRDVKNSLDTAHAEGREEALQEIIPLLEEARRREEEALRREEEARKEKEEALREKEEALRREEAQAEALAQALRELEGLKKRGQEE
jgi:DNA repair exonuclease SbcCD ATPase subunit